jgi:hypothetical protein
MRRPFRSKPASTSQQCVTNTWGTMSDKVRGLNEMRCLAPRPQTHLLSVYSEASALPSREWYRRLGHPMVNEYNEVLDVGRPVSLGAFLRSMSSKSLWRLRHPSVRRHRLLRKVLMRRVWCPAPSSFTTFRVVHAPAYTRIAGARTGAARPTDDAESRSSVSIVSRARRAISSDADWRRANRRPCPAQSERYSARPCFAAAVRSGRVSVF